MNGLFDQDDAATPLTPDERKGLIPTHVTLKRELNELEQKNILEAAQWAFQRKRNMLDEGALRRLHKRMFGKVWRWAGTFRDTPRNLGVEPWKIQTELFTLLDDARFWISNETYGRDEIAARFHHRLVLIHPFPNGNGRWARLAADLFLIAQGGTPFTWGRADLQQASETRKRYVEALHAADAYDISPLLLFVRS